MKTYDALGRLVVSFSTTGDVLGIQVVGLDVTGAGVKGIIEIPFALRLTTARMFGDDTGDVELDLWKTDYASYNAPVTPNVSDSICGGNEPAIVADTKSQDTTLTGWDTDFAAGDILAVVVNSSATITKVTLSLSAIKL